MGFSGDRAARAAASPLQRATTGSVSASWPQQRTGGRGAETAEGMPLLYHVQMVGIIGVAST